MPTIADFITFLEESAPLTLAAEWDNVGLLLGDKSETVQRLMTCLTVTPESANEAIDEKAQLIVSHHPILFRGAKKLTTATPEGGMLLRLARAGVAVFSAHTAFDNAAGGINDQLAQLLGLTHVRPLRARLVEPQCKIVVFVTDNDLTRVSDAMFAAGAGKIGSYRECSFRLAGTGTFFGSETSNPTIGQRGTREEVAEWRLEVVCPNHLADQVVTAMRSAHSYEEPAYDVYALRPPLGSTGEGRIGVLARPIPLQDMVRNTKSALHASVQYAGDPGQAVQRVALACGAAGEFLADAVRSAADVFLTGEARFHDVLAAKAHGIALVLTGHFASERRGVEALAERLQQAFPTVKTWASRREQDPLQCM